MPGPSVADALFAVSDGATIWQLKDDFDREFGGESGSDWVNDIVFIYYAGGIELPRERYDEWIGVCAELIACRMALVKYGNLHTVMAKVLWPTYGNDAALLERLRKTDAATYATVMRINPGIAPSLPPPEVITLAQYILWLHDHYLDVVMRVRKMVAAWNDLDPADDLARALHMHAGSLPRAETAALRRGGWRWWTIPAWIAAFMSDVSGTVIANTTVVVPNGAVPIDMPEQFAPLLGEYRRQIALDGSPSPADTAEMLIAFGQGLGVDIDPTAAGQSKEVVSQSDLQDSTSLLKKTVKAAVTPMWKRIADGITGGSLVGAAAIFLTAPPSATLAVGGGALVGKGYAASTMIAGLLAQLYASFKTEDVDDALAAHETAVNARVNAAAARGEQVGYFQLLADIEPAIYKLLRDGDALALRVKTLTAELNASAATITERNIEIEGLREDKSKLVGEKAAIDSQVEQLQDGGKALTPDQKNVSLLNGKIAEFNATIADLESEAETARQLNVDLLTKLQQANDDLKQQQFIAEELAHRERLRASSGSMQQTSAFNAVVGLMQTTESTFRRLAFANPDNRTARLHALDDAKAYSDLVLERYNLLSGQTDDATADGPAGAPASADAGVPAGSDAADDLNAKGVAIDPIVDSAELIVNRLKSALLTELNQIHAVGTTLPDDVIKRLRWLTDQLKSLGVDVTRYVPKTSTRTAAFEFRPSNFATPEIDDEMAKSLDRYLRTAERTTARYLDHAMETTQPDAELQNIVAVRRLLGEMRHAIETRLQETALTADDFFQQLATWALTDVAAMFQEVPTDRSVQAVWHRSSDGAEWMTELRHRRNAAWKVFLSWETNAFASGTAMKVYLQSQRVLELFKQIPKAQRGELDVVTDQLVVKSMSGAAFPDTVSGRAERAVDALVGLLSRDINAPLSKRKHSGPLDIITFVPQPRRGHLAAVLQRALSRTAEGTMASIYDHTGVLMSTGQIFSVVTLLWSSDPRRRQHVNENASGVQETVDVPVHPGDQFLKQTTDLLFDTIDFVMTKIGVQYTVQVGIAVALGVILHALKVLSKAVPQPGATTTPSEVLSTLFLTTLHEFLVELIDVMSTSAGVHYMRMPADVALTVLRILVPIGGEKDKVTLLKRLVRDILLLLAAGTIGSSWGHASRALLRGIVGVVLGSLHWSRDYGRPIPYMALFQLAQAWLRGGTLPVSDAGAPLPPSAASRQFNPNEFAPEPKAGAAGVQPLRLSAASRPVNALELKYTVDGFKDTYDYAKSFMKQAMTLSQAQYAKAHYSRRWPGDAVGFATADTHVVVEASASGIPVTDSWVNGRQMRWAHPLALRFFRGTDVDARLGVVMIGRYTSPIADRPLVPIRSMTLDVQSLKHRASGEYSQVTIPENWKDGDGAIAPPPATASVRAPPGYHMTNCAVHGLPGVFLGVTHFSALLVFDQPVDKRGSAQKTVQAREVMRATITNMYTEAQTAIDALNDSEDIDDEEFARKDAILLETQLRAIHATRIAGELLSQTGAVAVVVERHIGVPSK